MKSTRRFAMVALVAFQLWWSGLCAAESKDSAPSAGLPGNTEKDTDYRLKWNVETLVGDYDKHGRHNPKWDQSAKAALLLFAEARTYSNSPRVKETLSKLVPAIRTALTNGCDDPLLLYLSARFV